MGRAREQLLSQNGRIAAAAAVFAVVLTCGVVAIVLVHEGREDTYRDDVRRDAEVIAGFADSDLHHITDVLRTASTMAGIVDRFRSADDCTGDCTCTEDWCLSNSFTDWVVVARQIVISKIALAIAPNGTEASAQAQMQAMTVITKSELDPTQESVFNELLPIGGRFAATMLSEMMHIGAGNPFAMRVVDSDSFIQCVMVPQFPGTTKANPFPDMSPSRAAAMYSDLYRDVSDTRQLPPGARPMMSCWQRKVAYFNTDDRIMQLYTDKDRHFRFFGVNTQMGADAANDEDRIVFLQSKESALRNPILIRTSSAGAEMYLEVEVEELGLDGAEIGLVVATILVTLAATALTYWVLLTLAAKNSLAERNTTLDELLGVLGAKMERSEVVSQIGFLVSKRNNADVTVEMCLREACEAALTTLPDTAAVVVLVGSGKRFSEVMCLRNKQCPEAFTVENLIHDNGVGNVLRAVSKWQNTEHDGSASYVGSGAASTMLSGTRASEMSDEALRGALRDAAGGHRVGELGSGGLPVGHIIATEIQGSTGPWGALLVYSTDGLAEADSLFVDEMGVFFANVIGHAEREKSKMEFLAMMSHEMYTPLHGIFGSVELLVDTEPKLTETQRSFTDSVFSATERMLKLVGSMVSYAELGEGAKLDLAWCDAVDIADTACCMVAGEAERKGLALSCHAPLPLSVAWLDAHRIEQILVQLLQNAIKFTDEGSVEVIVDEVGESVRFSVRDTGCGIPESAQDSLFELFSQGDNSITRSAGGTGMGLAVCAQIASLMRTRINVKSEVGKGTTFSLAISRYEMGELVEDKEAANEMEKSLSSTAPHSVALIGMPDHMEQSLECAMLRLGHKVVGAAEADVKLAYAGHTPQPEGAVLVYDKSADAQADASGHALYMPARIAKIEEVIASTYKPPEAAKEEVKKRPDRELRVLACEDDKLNRRLLKLFLRKLKCSVVFAEDGQFGVEAFRDKEAPFDIVFMDLHMPRKSGYDAAKEIRAMDANVPIVALTADHTSGVEEGCIAAGMQAMVNKPFKKDDIARMLDAYVSE